MNLLEDLDKQFLQSEPNPSLNRLARQIRLQRRASRLTQSELAGLAGVGLRFISDLENAKPGLEIGRVLKVAETLGLELSLLARTWPQPS